MYLRFIVLFVGKCSSIGATIPLLPIYDIFYEQTIAMLNCYLSLITQTRYSYTSSVLITSKV